MSAGKAAQRSASSASASGKKSKGFTNEERAAMKERIQELAADREDAETAVLVKIAEMPELDRAMGERLHALIRASVPTLAPRTWYGMPAYAKDGKVVCFFQSAQKFKPSRGQLRPVLHHRSRRPPTLGAQARPAGRCESGPESTPSGTRRDEPCRVDQSP